MNYVRPPLVVCPRCRRLVPIAPLEPVGRQDDDLAEPVAHVRGPGGTPCPPVGIAPYAHQQQVANLDQFLDEVA